MRTKRKREPVIPNKSILACDPSMTAFGWAVISWQGEIVSAGCIKTKPTDKKLRIRKADDFIRRINEMDMSLLGIIEEFNVNYIVSELPHGSQNAVAAKMLGGVAALVQALSDAKGIGIEWYSEADSKICVMGKRKALKQEMIDAIVKLYPDTPVKDVKYYDEAICDSVAIYHLAKQQSPTIKLMSNGH